MCSLGTEGNLKQHTPVELIKLHRYVLKNIIRLISFYTFMKVITIVA
jgi:hypothetical protein